TNRLIRIPTGMGKTFGVLGAWTWNRLTRADATWPRRLIWCLPMRVLVEQVAAEIRAALQRLGGAAAEVPVHLLMGGADAAEWQIHPEREAVLVGTQDMLLSRALNRGYGASRARWPMEFGLLSHDCLWVMDEVQLMDVGLATSAQLQAFRDDDAAKGHRPCKTWWMSATLQPGWLTTSPDTDALTSALPEASRVPADQRRGALWEQVHKPVRVAKAAAAKQLATLAAEQHVALGCGAGGPTLVVVNRVARAVEVFDCLTKIIGKDSALHRTELRLVHSRFRPAERAFWREAFLNRAACAPGTDRIVVSTQVVEAGVDMSSALLLTDLAPWPSLVQRFGRAARWSGQAQVIVVDGEAKDDKAAAPYAKAELDAALDALGLLDDVSPRSLEGFEESHPERLPALYPYQPEHLLLRQELDELFDTAADLSGTDIDISRFIRSGEERDVQVFWRSVAQGMRPESNIRAGRDELCAVPFLAARDWLCSKDRLKAGYRAWVWDWLDGCWRSLERRDIYPGQTLLVAAEAGGYDPLRGWDSGATTAVAPLPAAPAGPADIADAAEGDESLSIAAQWQTIAFHGQQVGRQARALADLMAPQWAPLFELAGRWHDAGKAHPAFQGSLRPHAHGPEIAKAPPGQWERVSRLYRMPDGSRRCGFRHELASTLALFALLRRCRPDHAGLLGPWRDLLVRTGHAEALPQAGTALTDEALSPLEREVLALDAEQLDLLLYLVCSHHGKVRMSWQASPADQASADDTLRIRGVRNGDVLPALSLAAADGSRHVLPAAELVLAPASVGLNPHTGSGWTERVLALLRRHGPFALAWLEALMRAADQRASRDATLVDPALENADNAADGLPGSDSPLARPARGGEAPAPLGEHPAQRGAQHGAGGRAGGSGDAGSRTRAPAHATRYVDTRLGTLSYLELAPHLALAARRVEAEIESGAFDAHPIDEHLIAELHRRLCAELTPQWAGWRRQEVRVGAHTPPEPHRVPLLMREYALDLQARLGAAGDADHLLDALAFAEGRLLSIHPFTDFNGRASRLFLRLLLRRLDLPDVDLVPDPARPESYFAALRAADERDWRPLQALWRRRIEQGPQP
ncbi:MAG: Fic family protein, partial [Burkholderiaceae bacterium]|nr:Fic family protein [Burkholderiaceae bacterium]